MPLSFPTQAFPTEQQKWARAVEKTLRDLDAASSSLKNRSANTASGQKGTTNRLQDTVNTLRQQVIDLQAQGELLVAQGNSIQDTVNYLNGLTTVSSDGNDFNTGNTTGDQTWRYSGSGISVKTKCPTGKLLVTAGSGQCTLQPGDGTANAQITFTARSADGSYSIAQNTYSSRVFSTSGNFLGVPLTLNQPLTGVPIDQDITISLIYGIWSSSNTNQANANFRSNSIIAQVLGR